MPWAGVSSFLFVGVCEKEKKMGKTLRNSKTLQKDGGPALHVFMRKRGKKDCTFVFYNDAFVNTLEGWLVACPLSQRISFVPGWLSARPMSWAYPKDA